MGKRIRTLIVGAIPVLVGAVALAAPQIPGLAEPLTVPYAAEGPGPTFNTLGEFDGNKLVEIDHTKTYPTSGHLNMTTVSVRHGMSLIQAIGRWSIDGDTIVPIEQIFPPNVSVEQVQQRNQEAFVGAENSALNSAYSYLKRPLAASVVSVQPDSPADGTLIPGDVITAVDGRPAQNPGDVVAKVNELKPGDVVGFEIVRDGKKQSVQMTTAAAKDDSDKAFLGVLMKVAPADGTRITFNLDDVGGPSAGLMFSLAIVDKLTPEELTGGKFIAGTGTIDADGVVGPIGGVEHKIAAAKAAGATVFLTPKDNCDRAVTADHDGLTLVKVETMTSAIDALKAVQAGKNVPECS